MKTRGKPQHAHGKRGHGTYFLLAYLEELIGPECRLTLLIVFARMAAWNIEIRRGIFTRPGIFAR
jgi:hypothetical protein